MRTRLNYQYPVFGVPGLGLVEKYQDWRLADRVFDLAWTHSQVHLPRLGAALVRTTPVCFCLESRYFSMGLSHLGAGLFRRTS